jgi:hypothetical protein
MSLYCVSTASTVTSLSGSFNACEISSRLKGRCGEARVAQHLRHAQC